MKPGRRTAALIDSADRPFKVSRVFGHTFLAWVPEFGLLGLRGRKSSWEFGGRGRTGIFRSSNPPVGVRRLGRGTCGCHTRLRSAKVAFRSTIAFHFYSARAEARCVNRWQIGLTVQTLAEGGAMCGRTGFESVSGRGLGRGCSKGRGTENGRTTEAGRIYQPRRRANPARHDRWVCPPEPDGRRGPKTTKSEACDLAGRGACRTGVG